MMRYYFIVITCFLFNNLFCQVTEFTGKWYAVGEVMGQELSINITINNTNNGLACLLDSPDQKIFGKKVDSIIIWKDSIYFEVFRGKYTGSLQKSKIVGFFNQGMDIELNFQRTEIKKKELKRPQTPKPPFNYYTEELEIENKKDNVTLSGTLTLPKKEGKHPVIILISGSGPQNRDSEVFKHKPFAVIADHLAQNGIGSFRYDDRGVEHSTGKFGTSDLNDFYRDAKAIVNQLNKHKHIAKIGLLGHSEGGIIAPWLASKSRKVKFVVMLAGPTIPPSEMMHEQRRLVYESMSMSEEEMNLNKELFTSVDSLVLAIEEKDKLSNTLTTVITNNLDKRSDPQYKKLMTRIQFAQAIKLQVLTPWYKSFISINPSSYLQKIKQPLLALNGKKDTQVPYYLNLPALKQKLDNGKCKQYDIVELDNLNHLFQHCETGNIDEYNKIEETISLEVLTKISAWINNLPK